MQRDERDDPAATAMRKVSLGVLLTLEETAALLDVAPMTVHRLPLPCIRIGRQYRFDPADVRQLIESSKEPVLPVAA